MNQLIHDLESIFCIHHYLSWVCLLFLLTKVFLYQFVQYSQPTLFVSSKSSPVSEPGNAVATFQEKLPYSCISQEEPVAH